MNMMAYDADNKALFVRRCAGKRSAKKEILFNALAYRVNYIVFKNKKYGIKEVYAW